MAEPITVPLVAEGWGDGADAVREFGSALEEAERSADEFAEAGQDAADSTSGFGSHLEAFAPMATAAAGAIAAAAAGAIAWANATESTMGVLNRMPGSLRAAQDAVGGMVSEMDLAISRNRLMQAGLRLTDEQFADVAEVATDYAAAIGGDPAQATQQLGDALTSLSAEALGRFGVAVDASKPKTEQYADALAQLRERAAAMETGADTAGGAVGRFTVMLQDAITKAQQATDVITQQMGPAFDNLAVSITGVEDETISWREATQWTEDVFVGFTAAALAGLETIIQTVAEVINRFRDLAGVAGAAFSIVMEEGWDALSGRAIRERMGPILGDIDYSITETFTNALDRNLRSVVEAQGEIAVEEGDGGRTTPAGGAGARSSGPQDLRTAEQQIEDMLAAQQGAEAAARAMEEQTRAANEAALSARFALGQWSEGLDAQAAAAARAAEAQQQLIERQKELVAAADEAAAAFRDSWRQGVDAVVAAANEANEAASKAGTSMVTAMEAAGMATRAVASEMGDALLGGIANAFAGAAKAAAKGEQGFGEALAGMLEDTLWSIGSQALVLSVFEFAKAIAEAASQNYVGAAAHAAAGAAYGAVAALAFGGAAGLSAASAGSASSGGGAASNAPASPQPSESGGEGSVTNITVLFGGSVVTAATHAEIGREVGRALDASDARWKRAA